MCSITSGGGYGWFFKSDFRRTLSFLPDLLKQSYGRIYTKTYASFSSSFCFLTPSSSSLNIRVSLTHSSQLKFEGLNSKKMVTFCSILGSEQSIWIHHLDISRWESEMRINIFRSKGLKCIKSYVECKYIGKKVDNAWHVTMIPEPCIFPRLWRFLYANTSKWITQVKPCHAVNQRGNSVCIKQAWVANYAYLGLVEKRSMETEDFFT